MSEKRKSQTKIKILEHKNELEFEIEIKKRHIQNKSNHKITLNQPKSRKITQPKVVVHYQIIKRKGRHSK